MIYRAEYTNTKATHRFQYIPFLALANILQIEIYAIPVESFRYKPIAAAVAKYLTCALCILKKNALYVSYSW